MHTKETICGEEVNVVRSKDGTPRAATVLLGPREKPGARAKDGPDARAMRKLKRSLVAKHLGLPVAKVRALARYSCLTETEYGFERRDAKGRVIGTHLR